EEARRVDGRTRRRGPPPSGEEPLLRCAFHRAHAPLTAIANNKAHTAPRMSSTRSESTRSSGAPPPPCSSNRAYRKMASTNGTIASWNHTGLPTVDDFSNAHRQYARIVTLDATARR